MPYYINCSLDVDFSFGPKNIMVYTGLESIWTHFKMSESHCI